ncbi:MAG: alkene reductase [Gemmatimonadales bacterium]|nr:alkene reductase [Gemmatimonadales bacterium]
MKLMTPLMIGDLRLPNRVIMAPLTRCRATANRVPNALMAEHYRQRAGAGLILSEGVAVDPMGVGYPNTPGIWNDEQITGWRLVTDAVREAKGRIFMQLWHVGRISDPVYLDGAQPVAPSALAQPGHVSLVTPKRPYPIPRALAKEEIPAIVAAYRRGAENARQAGFDGVELHGANGYLIDQFLQASSNRRDDAYGGSITNRARFLLEVTDAVCEVWGPERVGMHLAPRGGEDPENDPTGEKIFGYVARELAKRDLAFICAREPQTDDWLGPRLKEAFGGVYIANQDFTGESAEEILCHEKADAVAFGRLYIANPDLEKRLANDLLLNTPDPETFFGDGAEGYTDYSVV